MNHGASSASVCAFASSVLIIASTASSFATAQARSCGRASCRRRCCASTALGWPGWRGCGWAGSPGARRHVGAPPPAGQHTARQTRAGLLRAWRRGVSMRPRRDDVARGALGRRTAREQEHVFDALLPKQSRSRLRGQPGGRVRWCSGCLYVRPMARATHQRDALVVVVDYDYSPQVVLPVPVGHYVGVELVYGAVQQRRRVAPSCGAERKGCASAGARKACRRAATHAQDSTRARSPCTTWHASYSSGPRRSSRRKSRPPSHRARASSAAGMRLNGSGRRKRACTRPCASCSSSLRRLKPLSRARGAASGRSWRRARLNAGGAPVHHGSNALEPRV